MLAAMAGVLAAMVVAVAIMSLLIWPRSPANMLRAELDEEILHIQHGLRVDADGRVDLVLKPESASTYDAMPKDTAYRVLDSQGRTVAESIEGPALQALATMKPDDRTVTIPSGDLAVRLQVTEQRIVHRGQTYTVRVARSDRLVTTLNDYAGKLYLRSGTVTVLLALATFGLVVFLTVRRMLRPLRRASEVASRIGPRTLDARLQPDRLPAELVPLIDAFNAALGRLQNGFRVQQEFLASAAHELKTPLALLQAQIELGGATDKALLLRDTALMARQVHQLLQLAEVSEGHNYQFAAISLDEVVADAAEYLARLADQRSVHLDVQRGQGAGTSVEADAAAVFVLAKNLLENALHHAPAGSGIRVRIGATGFSVEDEGPGVAQEDRSRLFERFWRGKPREGDGAGLGLAICREICIAHGWRICLDSAYGPPGARFVVDFPAPGAA
ncbi:MAG TPA: two-component sensor histidine kinase [Xanthomonadaceae bacterium]|nr:two-component sensor histidine kinase [Xanthomonadaceae bacterium]